MTEIFVERHWDTPLTDADMQAMIAAGGRCLGLYRCDWHRSWLSADCRELCCHFSGPDAESVRIALRQAGSPAGRVWAASIHDAPGATAADLGRANVLVTRRFAEPVEFAAIQALEEAGAGCLETHRVRFVRTYFSTDRKRMVCVYHAPDAESVRLAQREARMPVERVWAARQFRP